MKRFFTLLLSLLLASSLLTGCAVSSTPGDTNPPQEQSPELPTDPDNVESPDGNDETGSPEQDEIVYGSTGTIGTDPLNIPADAINVLERGVSAVAGEDQTDAINRLFNTLSNGDTVYFPTGTYEISSVLNLSGKSNITLLGDRAEIVHTGAVGHSTCATSDYSSSGIFKFSNMRGIAVQGLTVRYANPTSLSGVVTAHNGGSLTVQITDGSVLTGEECVMCVDTFDSDGTPDYRLEQYNTSTGFSTTKLSADSLRISGNIYPSQNIVGAKVCLRLSLSSAFAFTVFNTSDFVVQDVTVCNSFNGAFLIEAYTQNATFRNVVVRSNSSDALMSTNADILHIAGLGGTLLIENCTFDSPGDDSLNIHTMAAKIGSLSGTTLRLVHPETNAAIVDSRQVMSGDTLAFYNPLTFECLGSAKVTRLSLTGCTIDALPSGVTVGTLVSNSSLHPSSVTIKNCTVRQSRARGFLLQTSNVTVEQCLFYGTALSAILIAPDITNWYEMQPSSHITIRQNKFEKCATHAKGVILLAADHDGNPTSPSSNYVRDIHTDIHVTDNLFSACPSSAVMAACTTRLTFTDNVVERVGTDSTTRYVLYAARCDTVTLSGNTIPAGAYAVGNNNSINLKEE